MNIGIVVPHIFMQQRLLEDVIFSPADLAIELAEQIQTLGEQAILYTPGEVKTRVKNICGDMSGFEAELRDRGYGFIELLKKHPLTFATLARQVQADLIAQAFEDANSDKLDVIHIYANEEDIGLHFARFCQKPVILTHHDPFNLTVGYKQLFPRKKALNYIAISEAQKSDMPPDTNWVATIHHGIRADQFKPGPGNEDYALYLGRIIESKGVHHAITAVNQYNQSSDEPLKLKIAGKYYQDDYFETYVEPLLNEYIEFVGFIKDPDAKQSLIGNAVAQLIPSTFKEPFGLVAIEALACGTPVIGFASGALPEIIKPTKTGFIVNSAEEMADALAKVATISREACRADFEQRFTSKRMAEDYIRISKELQAAP